ncbi:MAG: C4-dicarboxylate ABC transporter substrate-binding protein, partial [Delftia sp.]|nr:C4-dicarboxylate ABC transporter substrate-binding protein [Delftia sp.]
EEDLAEALRGLAGAKDKSGQSA